MGCIDHQPYAMLQTERLHRLCIHCPIDAQPVMQGDGLLARLGAVVIGLPLGTLHETLVRLAASALFQHLYGLTPFRRSSKYQYHASPCLNRCVKYFEYNSERPLRLSMASPTTSIVVSVR